MANVVLPPSYKQLGCRFLKYHNNTCKGNRLITIYYLSVATIYHGDLKHHRKQENIQLYGIPKMLILTNGIFYIMSEDLVQACNSVFWPNWAKASTLTRCSLGSMKQITTCFITTNYYFTKNLLGPFTQYANRMNTNNSLIKDCHHPGGPFIY